MQLDISTESLPVYEALASNVRLAIIHLLAKKKMSIKELAENLSLSSAIITMHIRKLEEAHLIKTEKIGQKKISSLRVDQITISLPQKIFPAFDCYVTEIPVGHYTNFHVTPTCGLASATNFIANVDEPKFFMEPGRMDAQILWFTEGFVEYQTPNMLETDEKLEMLELSLELSSEFPFANDNWPSDITFSLNHTKLGTWTSPGDFADIRGKYTPDWYPDNLNQYGLLKTIRITQHGTYIDADPLSDITIQDLKQSDIWTFRIEVLETAENKGGCTIFGEKFGNHPQTIQLKSYYS